MIRTVTQEVANAPTPSAAVLDRFGAAKRGFRSRTGLFN